MNKDNQFPTTNHTKVDALPSNFKVEDYQAFYHWLNAKPDSEIKIFHDVKRLNINDLRELNIKIIDRLNLQEVISCSTTVSVVLSSHKVLEFGNWEKFFNYDFNISQQTKSLSVIWDFYIKLPNYQLPQRHTLKIRLGSHLKPGEFFQLMWQSEDDFQIEEAAASAVCKIDFISPIISNDLFGIVSGWHEALPKNFYTNNSFKILKRHKGKLEQTIISLFLIAGSLLIAGGLNYLNSRYNLLTSENPKLGYGILAMLLAIVGLYISYIIGKFWSARSERMIEKIQPFFLFTITKGDNNKIDEVKNSNKKVIKKLVREFSFAILIDILAVFGWKLLKYCTGIL